MEYAKEVYKPLFHFPKTAAPGLRQMLKDHPESFSALAMKNPIPDAYRKRLALAFLLGKWDMMQALGLEVTEKMRVDNFERATGQVLSTIQDREAVERRIARALKKSRPKHTRRHSIFLCHHR